MCENQKEKVNIDFITNLPLLDTSVCCMVVLNESLGGTIYHFNTLL